jgi:hypothetical protein
VVHGLPRLPRAAGALSGPGRTPPLFPDRYRSPYGSPAALENLGTAAAPLLAGFSFALIGFVLDKGRVIWEPDVALALLVLAGSLLIFCVQFAFNARRYYVPPEDHLAFVQMSAGSSVSEDDVRGWQGDWLDEHERWARLARRMYNLGILALLFGVTLVLVPDAGPWDMAPARVVAVSVAALATLVELEWFLGGPRWLRSSNREATRTRPAKPSPARSRSSRARAR